MKMASIAGGLAIGLALLSCLLVKRTTIAATELRPADGCPVSEESDFQFGPLPRWTQFKQHYHKHYRTISEQSFRLQQFLASSMRVAQKWFAYRYTDATTYFFTLNQYSDLTAEEKNSKLGVKLNDNDLARLRAKQDHAREKRSLTGLFNLDKLFSRRETAVHYSIDWRSHCLPKEPVNQGECGCCYIMASVKMFEWLYCDAKKVDRKFSEQYLVDCGHEFGLNGCEFGNLEDSISFIKHRGLLSATEMPYLGQSQQVCPIDFQSMSTREDRHQLLVWPTVIEYKALVMREQIEQELERSPLIILVCLSDEFYEYGGGVYVPKDHEACGVNSTGHFMLLVGHGQEERAGDFWLFANSYGAEWGESNGHIRISLKGAKSMAYALKLRVAFNETQVESD